MKLFRPPELPDLLVIDPQVHHDRRGFLLEAWQQQRYYEAGIDHTFVMDVHSHSVPGVLRGLHFQHPNPQGKIVRVTRGTVHDVAVDVRVGSPTFARWWSVELSEENRRQLWIPPGFAHGFLSLSTADVQYRCTSSYLPAYAQSIAWDDAQLGIDWPITAPILSDADATAPTLADLEREGLLPEYT